MNFLQKQKQIESLAMLATALLGKNIPVRLGKTSETGGRSITIKDCEFSGMAASLLHEVGHLKYTDFSAANECGSSQEFDMMNVFEDIRCDWINLQKYPGAKSKYLLAYGRLMPILADKLKGQKDLGHIGVYLLALSWQQNGMNAASEVVDTFSWLPPAAKSLCYSYMVKAKHAANTSEVVWLNKEFMRALKLLQESSDSDLGAGGDQNNQSMPDDEQDDTGSDGSDSSAAAGDAGADDGGSSDAPADTGANGSDSSAAAGDAGADDSGSSDAPADTGANGSDSSAAAGDAGADDGGSSDAPADTGANGSDSSAAAGNAGADDGGSSDAPADTGANAKGSASALSNGDTPTDTKDLYVEFRNAELADARSAVDVNALLEQLPTEDSMDVPEPLEEGRVQLYETKANPGQGLSPKINNAMKVLFNQRNKRYEGVADLGELDENRLIEGFLGDDCSKAITTRNAPNVAISILLDASGSMGNPADNTHRSAIAYPAAAAITTALSRVQGVSSSTALFGTRYLTIKRFHQALSSVNWTYECQGGTQTGNAISSAVSDILFTKAQQRFIFVITDGEPDDSAAVAQAVSCAKAMGVVIIPILICFHSGRTGFEGLVTPLHVDNIEALPRVLMQQLRKAL